jgi:hypothetical protein
MANDWDIIKTEYVQGFIDENGNIKRPTLKELSERYHCSYSNMKHKSSIGNWIHERKLFKKEREGIIQQKKRDLIVDEVVELNSESLKASKIGIKAVIECFRKSDLKPLGFQRLSIALINLHKVGLLALGEPTEHVKNDNKYDLKMEDPLIELNDPKYLAAKHQAMDEYYAKNKKK